MAEDKNKKTEEVKDDAAEKKAAEAKPAKAEAKSETAEKKAPTKKAAAKPAAEKKPADEKKAPAKKAAPKKAAAPKKDAEEPKAEGDDAEEKAAKKPAAKKAAPKKAAPAEPAEPTFVRATARYVRSAPRKARLVVDHIRGESVEDARVFLQFTARHVGRDVAKVLESAVANAEHNHELDGDDLHIVKAYVDEGPTLKRWRPRAKGRATQILKRTSHITVVVSDVPAKELKKTGKAAA